MHFLLTDYVFSNFSLTGTVFNKYIESDLLTIDFSVQNSNLPEFLFGLTLVKPKRKNSIWKPYIVTHRNGKVTDCPFCSEYANASQPNTFCRDFDNHKFELFEHFKNHPEVRFMLLHYLKKNT